jgi:hypothetical protein
MIQLTVATKDMGEAGKRLEVTRICGEAFRDF